VRRRRRRRRRRRAGGVDNDPPCPVEGWDGKEVMVEGPGIEDEAPC
jgi:hypothetical protein